MKHISYLEEPPIEVKEAGAHGIKLRTVIGEKDGANKFFMRVITFDADSSSPNHAHPYEHEVFVLNGRGVLEVDGNKFNLKAGDVAFVPSNANHCFRTQEPMEML